jgi:hypothetical protein
MAVTSPSGLTAIGAPAVLVAVLSGNTSPAPVTGSAPPA